MLGAQPLVRPVFGCLTDTHKSSSMEIDDYSEKTDREEGIDCSEDAYDRKDYLEINFRDSEEGLSPSSCDETMSSQFRPELKRPDLKGSFRCSICSKVFCHSSSLSRHRMQSHFKSYKCTLCRKDITSNETLRTHMYKQHQISRMFMCRCCNWAFPDKTSLHTHIQAREDGKSMGGPIISKSMHGGPVDSPQETSAFAPLNHASLPHNTVLQPNPNGMAFLGNPGVAAPGLMPADELSRLRERMMINHILQQQQQQTFSWLSNLPKPVPTTRPPMDLIAPTAVMPVPIGGVSASLLPSTSTGNTKEETIDVEKESTDTSREDADEENKEDSKRSESCSDTGCSSTSDGFSPSQISSHSPVDIFKKQPRMASAFHILNVDSRGFVPASPSHASPSDTNSSSTPDGACFECSNYKTKLTMAENKWRYLESRANSLQTEAVRAQAQVSAVETALRVLEGETKSLRDHTDILQRRLIDCQDQAMRFAQSDRVNSPQAVAIFLNQLIQSTMIR